ncbi:MAG: MoxR family ATPase [Lachnospiraceae bacterium]|nr:MoxR family ATPase [Lachnospiraceae bacterium]
MGDRYLNKQISVLHNEVKKVLKGKDDVILKVITAMIAGGHILLEDIPGVGKTTLAVAISKSLSMDYRRVQFTPDVLPSDLVGFNMYNSKTGEFEYREGSVYCNFLLADEINRTSPKTQSALLEVMEEGKATVDGTEHLLPDPFVVLATQNPFGSAGTQKLPESQLDRFMICLSIGYPDHESGAEILTGNISSRTEVNAIMTLDEFIQAKKNVETVKADQSIIDYIVSICEASRTHELVSLGLSPRASVALYKMAKATAYINERDYIIPDDVLDNLFAVCGHRLVISPRAKAQKKTVNDILKEIAISVPLPKI